MPKTEPIERCLLFRPLETEGEYGVLNRDYGWGECSAAQNALLHANQKAHVPASKLLRTIKKTPALDAFKTFVLPGFVHDGVRVCGNCLLPGHNRTTCKFPEAPELVEP